MTACPQTTQDLGAVRSLRVARGAQLMRLLRQRGVGWEDAHAALKAEGININRDKLRRFWLGLKR